MRVPDQLSSANGSRFIYVIAAVGFVFLGLLSHDYLFFAVALVPALTCLIQTHFQWRVMWAAIFALYLLESMFYLVVLVADVVAIFRGARPNVLLDLSDSIVFIAFVSFVSGVTWGLYRSKPMSKGTAPGV